MKTLAVLQPGYLPWLGFFHQMASADVFVYYDDVQFDKHGWRNRNRIKSAQGPIWLTVPVLHKGQQRPRIKDVRIDQSKRWKRKHTASLEQCYARAPYGELWLPALLECLSQPWELLVELDIALADLIRRWFVIDVEVVRASALGIEGERTVRLVELCKHFGATRYLSGDAAQDYLEIENFTSVGIEVVWQNFQHPVYPQMFGEFVPYLSAIDLLFNAGPSSLETVMSKQVIGASA